MRRCGDAICAAAARHSMAAGARCTIRGVRRDGQHRGNGGALPEGFRLHELRPKYVPEPTAHEYIILFEKKCEPMQ
jgi:hypothetical protein